MTVFVNSIYIEKTHARANRPRPVRRELASSFATRGPTEKNGEAGFQREPKDPVPNPGLSCQFPTSSNLPLVYNVYELTELFCARSIMQVYAPPRHIKNPKRRDVAKTVSDGHLLVLPTSNTDGCLHLYEIKTVEARRPPSRLGGQDLRCWAAAVFFSLRQNDLA